MADFRPTTQHVEVQGILGTELAATLRKVDDVIARELPPLNQQLDTKGLPRIAEKGGAPVRLIP